MITQQVQRNKHLQVSQVILTIWRTEDRKNKDLSGVRMDYVFQVVVFAIPVPLWCNATFVKFGFTFNVSNSLPEKQENLKSSFARSVFNLFSCSHFCNKKKFLLRNNSN